MVTRRRVEVGSLPMTSPSSSDGVVAASPSSASSTRCLTPTSSSTDSLSGQQTSVSPFLFGRAEASFNQVFHLHGTATTGSPRATPSSTPFALSIEPTSIHPPSSYDVDNPDTPLPSVERDVSSTTQRSSSPDVQSRASLRSMDTSPARSGSNQDAVLEQLGGLQNLRLTSPKPSTESIPQRRSRTPSIHVVPSPPQDDASTVRASRTGSLVAQVEGLHIRSSSVEGSSERPSPSPSRRRRSGSGIQKEVHQIESEEPPDTCTRMPEAQQALLDGKTLVLRMIGALHSSNLYREKGSSIFGLYRQAKNLDDFRPPSSRIIGLVGDSGAGKSSLINSLLDKIDLARASGSGTACTCAVTEYHFHDRDDFIIEVDYFAMAELKQQFEELLRAYRDFHSLPNDRGSRSGANGDEDDAERGRLEQKALLAQHTFRASFGSRLDRMPKLLSSIQFDKAVDTMINWASRMIPQQQERGIFDSIEACSARLKDLVTNPERSSVSVVYTTHWPFIQKLRVYLRANILSKGLIIADLPGLRDLNSARKAITERYIRQCHQIFVVARIDRAITDQSIKEVFDLARHVQLSKLDIVCTRSEDVNVREACHDWPAEKYTIQDMQKDIDKENLELQSLQDDIEEYGQDLTDLNREEERELLLLQQERSKVSRSKREHEVELLRYISSLRNQKVSLQLRKQYRNHPKADAMRIFCVSNKLYAENREKPVTDARPFLQWSGIIDLRRYCIGIVAQSQFRAITKFVLEEIPAFISSLQLWVEAGSSDADAARKKQITDMVAGIEEALEELTSPTFHTNTLSRTLKGEFDSDIKMYMSRNCRQWTADSRRASIDWQGLHHSSYKAFCAKYGTHKPRDQPARCWNEEAMESMTTDMSTTWNEFQADLESQLVQICDAVDQAFDDVLKVIPSTAAAKHRTGQTTTRALKGVLTHRKDLIIDAVEQSIETFRSDLVTLHEDALSPVRTAIIGKLMQATYHEANMEFGDGSDRRRKTIVTEGFGALSLFNDHRRECSDQFRDIAEKLQENIAESIEHHVGLVEVALQVLKDKNVLVESERDPEFRNRVSVEVERAEREVSRIRGVLQDEA